MPTTPFDPIARLQAPLSGSWRMLVTAPASGAANMAMDHALMERARRTGERCLRVYAWCAPTLSLGRHQLARGRIDPARAGALGVALVRRPTGGRALLHHREVTYSVTAPLDRGDSVRKWYDAINGVLLDALRRLGVEAMVAGSIGRTPAPAAASCFAQPDAGEITVGGRKLVGSALLREDGALLQHGSILLEDDQHLLDAILPAGELRPEPAGTLRQALGQAPPMDVVAGALDAALSASGDIALSALEPEPWLQAEMRAAERLYGSEEWTFRQ
jgi:lipoate-protein ligase A